MNQFNHNLMVSCLTLFTLHIGNKLASFCVLVVVVVVRSSSGSYSVVFVSFCRQSSCTSK